MPNTFFIADLHFGHANILQYCQRPFKDVDEMHNALITNWNRVVGPLDKVYVLGDAVIPRRALKFYAELNGKKRLIRGNHDIFKDKDYTPYFERMHAYRVFPDFICSHIPLHPASVVRYGVNVHGHLHGNTLNDPRYVCVSVEQPHMNFTPIELEDLRKLFPVFPDAHLSVEEREAREYGRDVIAKKMEDHIL